MDEPEEGGESERETRARQREQMYLKDDLTGRKETAIVWAIAALIIAIPIAIFIWIVLIKYVTEPSY